MPNQVELTDVTEVTELTILGATFNMYGTVDKPLFLAVDIADMIDYSHDKTDQMLALVDDDEKLTDTIYRAGQRREVWFVTEYGLYELLMQSRKPLAKRFKLEVKKALRNIRLSGVQGGRYIFGPKNSLRIDGAQLLPRPFKNFSGVKLKYNEDGDRNFCLIIDDPRIVEQLKSRGWNVKYTRPRNEDDEPTPYVPVTVRYDNYPPQVYLISKNSKTLLDEETVGMLDFAEMKNVDLVVTPSSWDVNGKTGLKAYLKTMYATILEDELADKYAYIDGEGEVQ